MFQLMLQKSGDKRDYFYVGLIWIFLWLVPWGKIPTISDGNFLAFVTEMPRLGLALLLFMIPGILLYFLLHPKDEPIRHILGVVPIGLTFSIAIISVIGLIGRLVGMSFTTVKTIFILFGLIEIALIAVLVPDLGIDKQKLRESLNLGWKNHALIIAVLFAVLMLFHDFLIVPDDASYMAYSTNWQHSTRLGFENLVHEMNTVEHLRFWLAIFPMSLSLLSDISGLPGILLYGNYLELFLVPVAVLTMYWFSRLLGFSRKRAGFSALIQVMLLIWMVGKELPVGSYFFITMAEDKVIAAFIMAPVFIGFGLDLIRGNWKQNGILFVLAGIGMTLTHPIVLFYASSILLCMGVFALVAKQTTWLQIFQVAAIVAGLMLPFLIILLLDSQMEILNDAVSISESHNYGIFVNVVNDVFYGLNYEALKFMDVWDNNAYQIFRLTPVLISIAAGIVSLRKFREGPIYWYVLSCVLLISVATIPYTGWILGYIVSGRMLSRSAWFLPLGIGGVMVLITIRDWLKTRKVSFRRKRFSETFYIFIIGFTFISPILVTSSLARIPDYLGVLDYYKQLAQVGKYIDEHSTDLVMGIALDYEDMKFLPGVSTQVRLVSFREQNTNPHNYFMSADEINNRIYASDTIRSLDPVVSEEERCSLIEEYEIQYVLAKQDNARIFQNLIKSCQVDDQIVLMMDDLVLLKLNN